MSLRSLPLAIVAFLIAALPAGRAHTEDGLYKLGPGDWSGGISLGLSERSFSDLTRRVESALFRIDYSPYERLVVFGGVGATKLFISGPGGAKWDYEGGRKAGFLIGFEADLFRIERAYTDLFIIMDMGIIPSEGRSVGPGDGWTNEYSNSYTWREYRGAFGVRFAYSSVYVSIGGGKVLVDGVVDREHRIISGGETTLLGREKKGFYSSDIPAEPFLELGVLLPDMWKLGIELSGKGRRNYSIVLKILQMYG